MNAINNYTTEEFKEFIQIIYSMIVRCEKMQPKFVEGTSQHTLLKNRIKALYISKSLITDEHGSYKYTKEELNETLRPISSIISKCEKAQLKFIQGNKNYVRFDKMIKAMTIAESLITDEICKTN